MTATEYVILVDENDQEIGLAEKLDAHQRALLHRAFSIFIFRKNQGKQEVLLQQRALVKYHSAGLWTNTCCSHPRQQESILAAAERRLFEEFGFKTTLKTVGRFHYFAPFENGLTENEIDHVLIGFIAKDFVFKPDPNEIADFRWLTFDALEKELASDPTQFTPWFQAAWEIAKTGIALYTS